MVFGAVFAEIFAENRRVRLKMAAALRNARALLVYVLFLIQQKYHLERRTPEREIPSMLCNDSPQTSEG